MTPKEIVLRTLEFRNPERMAMRLAKGFTNDFDGFSMSPHIDARPSGKGQQRDEWGALWNNIGISRLGEVIEYPLASWDNFGTYRFPDILDPKRWEHLQQRPSTVDYQKFVCVGGLSLYERIHFLRGLENTWTDIYLESDNLHRLLDKLVEMNLEAMPRFQALGADGFVFCDDWGLQNKLMISPDKWMEFWFEAYRRVYEAAHRHGMKTLLHSCGYIVDILDPLIEAGLDAILMDQQCNMSLELLSRYKGRITFCCPVDIQAVMPRNDLVEIREYCHKLFESLGSEKGGFIADYYGDPVGAGHTPEAVQAMCEEFEKIGRWSV